LLEPSDTRRGFALTKMLAIVAIVVGYSIVRAIPEGRHPRVAVTFGTMFLIAACAYAGVRVAQDIVGAWVGGALIAAGMDSDESSNRVTTHALAG
jgi:hypothetical protein